MDVRNKQVFLLLSAEIEINYFRSRPYKKHLPGNYKHETDTSPSAECEGMYRICV